MKKVVDATKFNIPVAEIKQGFYSDAYFLRTAEILTRDNCENKVLMQVFQRSHATLCGMEETLAILKTCSHNTKNLKIHALSDGDKIAPWETVMTIEGNLKDFTHLETIYLGILARQTKVATNVANAVAAANGKSVLFFASRYDHYTVQKQDGYAAHIGGVIGVSTDANGAFIDRCGLGTIPHALIANYSGDTLQATMKFDQHIDPKINRVALVDFTNDCVNTSLEIARKLQGKLFAVRLDTSNNMVDKSLLEDMSNFNPTGVCPELVFKVREALDNEGFQHVKIMVSGGFNPKKIAEFEARKVPVDTYAVGSSFFGGSLDFTADVVMLNGQPCSKVGRKYNPNPRLVAVDLS